MLVLIVIGLAPVIIASSIIVRSYEDRAVSVRISNVKNQCDMLCNLVVSEGFLERPSSKLLDSELTLVGNVYNGRILIVDSSYKVIKDTFDIDSGKTSVSKEVISCFQSGSGSTHYDNRNAFIEITAPITDGRSSEVKGVLLASISTNEILQTVRYLENQATLIVVLMSTAILLMGFVLANMLVKPFHDVTRAIEDVTDGFEDQAISVPDYSETMQIIEAFNNMLARVRALDNSRQEFVSNVSHELKTPLTSMKVLADSINGADNVPVEVYREFMSDITTEIDRENSIITSLLTMVRLDKKAASMNWSKVEIGPMLEQIIKRLKPIADKRSIDLILDPYQPVTAEVDEMKMSLAFSNLIENGIKYNIDEGWVRVTLKADSKYFYVSVADCGLGIAEDQVDHIFERFYRGDKSHSTEIEGTGLGLSITKSVIVLHRGVIKVSSMLGKGTTFMVRIPLVRQEN
ncbi:MAG: HAMP domain-containing histidine kinase [Clostridiales bacterium]|jgi:signal transduction histidine kinase|uniref:sensor histidine kinase n=1 Tax=Chordicoccus furentiruminis TaxID=2709410 RepID=UPI0023A87799|nr:HAMP domain-containing sensor histidine kinase [Chordicoccus furentiruminis]MCI6173637.1 HAMP domain-containing histidine kinase [Clostridiales bacterium]